MKTIDIAIKDITQSFRSAFALAFMFGVPILMTGMFYLMFGGGGSDEGFNLSATKVQVANLDQGNPMLAQGLAQNAPPAGRPEQMAQAGIDFSGADSMGDILTMMLRAGFFSDLVELTEAPDAASARAAVDNRQAGVAIIIPEHFTDALIEPDQTAAIELYQDPTLTLGPGIVKTIISQFVDNAAATKIGLAVTLKQLASAGIPIDGALQQEVAAQFLSAYNGNNSGNQLMGPDALIDAQAPASEQKAANQFMTIISNIMGGMMIFYAFFTGASMAQTILTEEEKGTLPRLFTTPTAQSEILGGKFLAAVLTILIQMIVLALFGRWVFGIQWGAPLLLALVILATVITTSTFGLFLVSWLKNSRQAGVVFGGVLTITGMVGMVSVFTMGAPNAALFTDTLSLIVPQGWAIRSLQMTMSGRSLVSLLPTFGGMLAMSAAFFVVAVVRFRKRFA
jgi:ABC-2 type transport system permease protein